MKHAPNGVYALLINAQEGIEVKMPLAMLPGDVQLGNIVTLTIQRNQLAEQQRH